MATEEWVKRAIENSKTYEELPPRVRTLLPVAEWKAKYAILNRSLRSTRTVYRDAHVLHLAMEFKGMVLCLSGSRSTASRKALVGTTAWQALAAQSQSTMRIC